MQPKAQLVHMIESPFKGVLSGHKIMDEMAKNFPHNDVFFLMFSIPNCSNLVNIRARKVFFVFIQVRILQSIDWLCYQ